MVDFLAHFDGRNLLPDEPVDLPTDKPLRVTVEEAAGRGDAAPLDLAKFFGAIEAERGLIEGPADWAAEHDHYLYGAAREERSSGG